jgi:serine phosphatase RsbU (regulator of sigma subunit)/PAS domain-containing protein
VTGHLGGSGRCLLVGLSPEERRSFTLDLAPSVLDAADEHWRLGALPATDPEVVVVGSAVPHPVDVVQRVHRAFPDAHPVVLTAPETVDRVRRELSYAPGVPLHLTVHLAGDGETSLDDVVASVLASAGDRRRHRAVMGSLEAAQPGSPPPRSPAHVDLGPFLEHAPVGVVVCEVDGRLRGWNTRAAALLGLADVDGCGQVTLPDLLPDAAPVLAAVRRGTPAGATGSTGPAAAQSDPAGTVVTAPTGREVEVTAVVSEGDEGRAVVLVLLVDVTERRRAERERERLAGHVDLLGAVSRSLESTLDMREALGRLTEVLVPAFADWASVQLADDDERSSDLSLVAVRHRDPAMADVVEAARQRQSRFASDRAPSRQAASRGEPVLLTDLDETTTAGYVEDPELRALFRRLGLSSLIAVPLRGRAGLLGSLVMVNGPESPTYTAHEVTVALEVGRRAGVALDNARLYGQQRDLAAELQHSLLTEPPQPDHGEIVVRYLAAAHEAQVGGDWYDAFIQPDGATVLVVGDVAGHDRRAAAGMSQVRGVLRGIGFTTGEDPARMLSRVDQAMEGLMISTIATAVVVRLEQDREDHAERRTRVSWANAGHPPPLLMRADGRVEPLTPDDRAAVGTTIDEDGLVPAPDMLLGFAPDTARTCWRACVPRGTTLFLYTDGLVERRGEILDEGLARLARTLEDIGAQTTLAELCDRAVERMVPGQREDDVALVAVRLHPDHRPRPPEAGPERVPSSLE